MILDATKIEETFDPRFLAFEGINGCGKSTLSKSIARRLAERGKEFISTFEPGDTTLGMEIRKLVLERTDLKIDPVAELLLFAADRAQHVASVIAPALQSQKIVLCDRYLYSTSAFQGFGRKLDAGLINTINHAAVGTCLPDLVVLIDLDVGVALSRAAARGGKSADRLEHEELEFHERIRNGFLELARIRPEPFLVLDGTKTPDELRLEVESVLHMALE